MAGILLIDDAQLMRNMMRTILEDAGYVVCGEAASGRQGIEKYKMCRPQLVFCDIMMDDMDGLECLRAIKAEDNSADVIMCTSRGSSYYVKEALSAGAKEFLLKPVHATELLRITERHIGKPGAGRNISYKKLMEERAVAAGIDSKPVLDFFEAFRKLKGFRFDDPRIDEQYLRENCEQISIGVRALLSAKLSNVQVEQIMAVFQGIVS